MFRAQHSVAAATAFLGTRFSQVADVELIGGGEWSQAFSFRDGSRELVVRFGAYVEDYQKDELAYRFATPELPIPPVFEIGQAFDAYYAVSARRYGDPLDHLDGAGLERTLPSVWRFLDALRVADVSETTGYGMWTPDGDAPFATWRDCLLAVGDDTVYPRSQGWRATLEGRPTDLEVFEEGYRQLESLAGSVSEARHLVHEDIVGDNVRVLDGQVTAVVDWGNARYGDFLYDLARLTFWVPWYPAWREVDIVGAAREHYASIDLEVPAFEERLRACQIYIGLEAQAYNVFTERWDELAKSGQRTLDLARGVSQP
jgi:hygromycin-B 4-O-kinase